ncbi:MAG: plastocyanin/azurin family copper-binding protein [Acidimicrobiales bacterium]
MRHRSAPFLLLASTLLPGLLTACGSDHDDANHPPERVIDVTMVDNAFRPDQLRVNEGETITFRFINAGTVTHEAVIGDESYQEAHHAEMTSIGHGAATEPGTIPTASEASSGDDHRGGGDHAHTAALTVAPGETVEITFSFDDRGTVLIGCHEPGHWEDGMKATITVA